MNSTTEGWLIYYAWDFKRLRISDAIWNGCHPSCHLDFSFKKFIEKLKDGNLGQGKMQNVPLLPRSLLLFLFCHPPFHLIPIPIHHRHQRDWLRLQKHYIRRSTFYIWMTYEVKAFNSNATREPVVRVTSKSRPQRIEGETRAARASIDAKVSLFILLTRGTIFEGNSFCRRTLLIVDFILMSRIFSFPLKKLWFI